MTSQSKNLPAAVVTTALSTLLSAAGCCTTPDSCNTSCGQCNTCRSGCDDCNSGLCNGGGCGLLPWGGFHGFHESRNAIPDILPLGAVTRAHWHMQQTNGEAADFVIYRNEFVYNSSELTPYGRDHIAEIAARMPSAPFPVLVQRSWNNADPELDQIRRDIVVRVLTDLGNPDAEQRVVVSQPYSNGLNSMEGEQDYGRFRNIRGVGSAFGGGGGFGGGGFGGGGF